MSYVKTQKRDSGSKKTPAVHQVESDNFLSKVAENNKDLDEKPLLERDLRSIIPEEAITIHNSKTYESRRVTKSYENLTTQTPVLKPVNNILDRHQRTRQLRNSTAKRLLQRAKTNNVNTSTRNIALRCNDKGNVGRKFILPVRSVHSSRVIKPNKRFIEELEESVGSEQSENDAVKNSKKARIASGKSVESKEVKCKSKRGGSCTSINDDMGNNKPKILGNETRSRNWCNSTCLLRDANPRASANETTSAAENLISVPTKVFPHTNVTNGESSRVQTRSGTVSEAIGDVGLQVATSDTLRVLPDHLAITPDGEFAGETTEKIIVSSKEIEGIKGFCEEEIIKEREKCKDDYETDSTMSDSASEHEDHSEDEQSEWTGMKLNGGKVILRKARLKLDNKSLVGMEGPFSTTNTHMNPSANGNAGTIINFSRNCILSTKGEKRDFFCKFPSSPRLRYCRNIRDFRRFY